MSYHILYKRPTTGLPEEYRELQGERSDLDQQDQAMQKCDEQGHPIATVDHWGCSERKIPKLEQLFELHINRISDST